MLEKLPRTKSILSYKYLMVSWRVENNFITQINNLLKTVIIQINSQINHDSSKPTPYALMLESSGLYNALLIHLSEI